MNPDTVARALAWFGIGLGVTELLAPRAVARATGLQGREGVVRLFGLREIASGVVILAARRPVSWLWLRTAGDGLDSALLASAMTPGAPDRLKALIATLAVSPIVALDAYYTAEARKLA